MTITLDDFCKSLREVRKSKKLSLRDVERLSDGKWKAIVIGSYERGDRQLSIKKLLQLAEFYEVPVAELLGVRVEPTEQSVVNKLQELIEFATKKKEGQ